MSQHDYNVANASGASVRSDLNSLAGAIVTWNAGGTAPSPTFPNMRWFDTSTGRVWLRDNANTTWLPFLKIGTDGLWTLDVDADDFDIFEILNASGDRTFKHRITSSGNGSSTWYNAGAAIAQLTGDSGGQLWMGGDSATGRRVETRELIDETTISSTTAQYVVTWDNALAFKYVEIQIDRLRPASADSLVLQTSTNGGVSYDSGASNYAWALNRTAGGSNNADTSNADNKISLSGTATFDATNGVSAGYIIRITNPANANCNTTVHFDGWFLNASGGNYTSVRGSGQRLSEADVDAARLVFSTQNIAEAQILTVGVR